VNAIRVVLIVLEVVVGLTAVGGSSAAAAVLTVTSPAAGARMSVLAGVILMTQVTGEIRLLRQPVSRIEVAYLVAGAAMAALGITRWLA